MFKKTFKIENSVYLAIYIIGFINWYLFFNFGHYEFDFEDWAFYYGLFSVWKTSLSENIIPFFATFFSEDSPHYGAYDNEYFFAKSWSIFQPQIILLKFLSIKNYLTFNILLFYSISYYSIILWINYLKIQKKYSYLLITILILNGKYFSQLGFGGIQMTIGYMLIPLFLWHLKNFLNAENNFQEIIKFSLFMFLILSQADMHIYYQMFIVAGLFTIFYVEKYLSFILVFVISTIASLWYVAPVVFYGNFNLPDFDHWRHLGTFGIGFANGFAGESLIKYSSEYGFIINSLILFLNFFIHIFELTTAMHNVNMPNTHEVNFYISIIGLTLISLGIIVLFYNYKKHNLFSSKKFYLISIFILMLLSSGPFHYFLIKFIKIFINFKLIDAVPSRFFLYFMIIITISSFYALSKHNIINNQNFLVFISFLLLILLLFHSYTWWMHNTYLLTNNKYGLDLFDINIYDPPNYKPFYKEVVVISFIFSSVSLLLLIFFSYIYKWNKFQK